MCVCVSTLPMLLNLSLPLCSRKASPTLYVRRLSFKVQGVCVCVPDSRLPKQLLVCAPIGGSRSVGGQKCRWNDLVQRDLVKCGLEQDWRELAQDRLAWRGMVKISVQDLNREAEKKDDKKKDEKKRNQQVQLTTASASLICDHPNCSFIAVNRLGLVNHTPHTHTHNNSYLTQHTKHNSYLNSTGY